jgi:2-oxoglutarate dehydrogenase E1 component
LQTRVDGLVYAYCSLGHTIARIDPLAETRPTNPLLRLSEFGFTDSDLDLRVSSKFFLDNRSMTLRDMVAGLDRIYADSIGSEFMHIQDPHVREWIRRRLETRPHKHSTPRAVQVALLRALLEAESFEIFLHTRYVGQKRFSLQGAETLLVALETILHKCPDGGVEEICMGMAHRGRLNVLANFLRKSLKVIFTEFSENYIPDLVAGDGDVKYHLGYQAVRRLASGARSRSGSRRTRAIWKLSIQSSKGKRAPGNEFAAIPSIGKRSCRCSCTAMRHSSRRESWPRR